MNYEMKKLEWRREESKFGGGRKVKCAEGEQLREKYGEKKTMFVGKNGLKEQ